MTKKFSWLNEQQTKPMYGLPGTPTMRKMKVCILKASILYVKNDLDNCATVQVHTEA